MKSDVAAPASEWHAGWKIVLTAALGMSLVTMYSNSAGVVMKPLQDAFGWSRTQVSFGLTVFAIVSLPLAPFAGMLVDRLGPRRIAIPGLLLSGACFAAFGLMSGADGSSFGPIAFASSFSSGARRPASHEFAVEIHLLVG